MDLEKNDLDRVADEEENCEKTDTVSGDNAKNGRILHEKLLVALVYARYLLPFFTVLLSFLLSCIYCVGGVMGRRTTWVSLLQLFGNTLVGMHDYLGGKTSAGQSWFYGILSAGAILGILLFLVALFLTGLAAYTAVRAFRAGYKSEESNRMKLIFKVPFPNRVWLYLSDLLVLLPLLYPYFLSFVGEKIPNISGEPVRFQWNIPLFVCAGLCLVTLGLSFLVARTERAKHMNMFLLYHEEPREQPEDE
ncbi:MAG: hypothetical protein E7624_05375 [Ruminococcaceae bacterium]|nr:hypothetical protein [Oscillospiraceae bacterium]